MVASLRAGGNDHTAPRLTVIVVADFGDAENRWRDERLMLAALAAQDFAEPFDILLAQSETLRAAVPADLLAMAPRTRVVFLPETGSACLKNAALPHTATPLVSLMDADAVPSPNWLRLVVGALDADPQAGAVSGRTIYGNGTSLMRAMGLLHRSYLNTTHKGRTGHVSNSNAVYRRAVLEQHPYPDEPSPFVSCWLRQDAMLADGVAFLYVPEAIATHQFDGFNFADDLHRNVGFMLGRYRLLAQPDVGSAWPTVARMELRRIRNDWANVVRSHRDYIRWHDWPLVLYLLLVMRWREAPAMKRGLAGERSLDGTAFF